MFRENSTGKSPAQSHRLDRLKDASKALGRAHSRLSLLERQRKNPPGPGEKKYDVAGLRNNAHESKREAEILLRDACGACALRNACNINSSLEGWEASHPKAGSKITEDGRETRKGMLSRIKKNPDEACDPLQINYWKLPTTQLEIDFKSPPPRQPRKPLSPYDIDE